MSKAVKVFVVEGEKRDLRYIESLKRLFLEDFHELIIISVPAAGNIYMLYEKLESDGFETDVIEVLRENIKVARDKLMDVSRDNVAEVYLFFDADLHHNRYENYHQATTILNKMLSVFDNETENGKLYISYPMVEALYDVRKGQCETFSKCYITIDEFSNYKKMAGTGNNLASRHFNSEEEWRIVIQAFYLRTKCLFDCGEMYYEQYKKIVTPMSIFQIQNNIIDTEGKVFVMSALPELLLDYFKKDFWDLFIDENCVYDLNCKKKYLQ